VVSTIRKYTLESFSECTGVSNVVEVGRKRVPGGRATVGETSFSRSSSCSWQNVIRRASRPHPVSATDSNSTFITSMTLACALDPARQGAGGVALGYIQMCSRSIISTLFGRWQHRCSHWLRTSLLLQQPAVGVAASVRDTRVLSDGVLQRNLSAVDRRHTDDVGRVRPDAARPLYPRRLQPWL